MCVERKAGNPTGADFSDRINRLYGKRLPIPIEAGVRGGYRTEIRQMPEKKEQAVV